MNACRELYAHHTWYVAAWSHEVKDRPLRRRLLGEELVLFRDARGEVKILAAECPHRGADLGAGRIQGDVLACPFHGWCFDGEGRCTRVPSQPESHKIPRAAKVRAFPAIDDGGVIWIWPGPLDVERPAPPRCEHWDLAGAKRSYCAPQLCKAPFVVTLENGIDNAHLAFVHRRTAMAPMIIKPQIVEPSEDGRSFVARDAEVGDEPAYREKLPLPGFEGLMLGVFAGLGEHTAYHYGYRFPGQFFHHFRYANGTVFCAVGNATPADEHETWFFTDSVRTVGTHFMGDFAHWLFNRRLSFEDQEAVKLVLSRGPGGRESPVSVAADKPALTMRRIYARWARAEGLRAPWDVGTDEADAESPAPLRSITGG
jgi:phenylpropionate dioxygenase-like ring-hydroxylating dioxygenase large terminal subunit